MEVGSRIIRGGHEDNLLTTVLRHRGHGFQVTNLHGSGRVQDCICEEKKSGQLQKLKQSCLLRRKKVPAQELEGEKVLSVQLTLSSLSHQLCTVDLGLRLNNLTLGQSLGLGSR